MSALYGLWIRSKTQPTCGFPKLGFYVIIKHVDFNYTVFSDDINILFGYLDFFFCWCVVVMNDVVGVCVYGGGSGYDGVGVGVYDGGSCYDVVGVGVYDGGSAYDDGGCGFFLYFIRLQKFSLS